MKILEVGIHNFMAIGEARIDLADRGLVLIQGLNADDTSAKSNGAGKSSIADALCWCLYGETARGESGDAVVNDVEKKDCSVVVLALDGDNYYQIYRFRKHKVKRNALCVGVGKSSIGPFADLTKGTEKLTQELVNQIIGCSYDVFCGAVYAGQERMPNMPGMTDKQLKMLIEEASGATILEAAYKEAATRLGTAKVGLIETTRTLDATKTNLESEKLRRASLQLDMTIWDSRRTAEVVKLTGEAVTQKSALDNIVKTLGGMSTLVDLEKKIAECNAQIAGVAGEQKNLEDYNVRLAEGERDASIKKIAADTKAAELKRAEKELTELDHKVGCPCSSCARPFSAADIAPAKKLTTDKIATLKNSVSELSKHVSYAHNRITTLTHERDTYRASMTDLTATNALRASLTAQAIEVRRIEGERERLVMAIRSLLEGAKAKRVEENPYKRQLAEVEKAIFNLDKDVEVNGKLLETAIEQVTIHEAAAKVFSPAGVRAFLLDEVTPFLNDQTAKYLGTLSDGNIQATWTTLVKTAKGDLREKFSIEVTNNVGGKSFGLISGGEKRKVRIACALALQDLVARRATKPIELFIGDEIDDALDSAGLERLTTILEEKAKERGSVFIISHSDIRDWVRNVLLVKRTGGKSVIEEIIL
jgi:DNA repair exonuclease SbcCD ATPase subunit